MSSLLTVLNSPTRRASAGGSGGALDYLYTANHTGDYWDMLTFNNLYQDSEKLTPVTAAGQPVGAVVGERGTDMNQAGATSKPTAQTGYVEWTLGAQRFLNVIDGFNKTGTFYGYTLAYRAWQVGVGAFTQVKLATDTSTSFGSNDYIALNAPNGNAANAALQMGGLRSVSGILYNSTPQTYIWHIMHNGTSPVAYWISVNGGAKQNFNIAVPGPVAVTQSRLRIGTTASTHQIRSSRIMQRYTWDDSSAAVDLSTDDITNIHNWLTNA